MPQPRQPERNLLLRAWDTFSMPLLAIVTAFVLGGIVIWITSGKLESVIQAYSGMLRGAFFKQRGFSETLIATVPYILLSLGVAVGFKSGLFNIGVEGQFYVGAVCATYVGFAVSGLPAIIHLPLTLLAGAAGGAVWAGIPGQDGSTRSHQHHHDELCGLSLHGVHGERAAARPARQRHTDPACGARSRAVVVVRHPPAARRSAERPVRGARVGLFGICHLAPGARERPPGRD
jgi:hypothetical protein